MKKDIIEYHPNGNKKHVIIFYSNGNKLFEQFYDQQEQYHRTPGLPDYQSWYDNGIYYRITYYTHGKYNNIDNPSSLYFKYNGKIWAKVYYVNNQRYFKLTWMNLIKNIL